MHFLAQSSMAIAKDCDFTWLVWMFSAIRSFLQLFHDSLLQPCNTTTTAVATTEAIAATCTTTTTTIARTCTTSTTTDTTQGLRYIYLL